MKSLLTVMAIAFLAACPQDKPPEPPPNFQPDPDAGFDDDETLDAAGRDECSFACQHARTVGCSAGFSVDGGESCTASCRHVRDTRLTRLDITCMRTAPSNAAAKKCAGWGCQ